MRGALAVLPALLLACGERPAPAGEPADAAAGESAPAVGAPASVHVFDPSAIRLGDTVLGLTVVAAELTRALEDSLWVGAVVLEGDLVLHGIYQQHPDWPQVELPCVHVVQAPSLERIPRFPADPYAGPDPKTWFCLENAELAVELLGNPEPPREVVIAVSRYRVQRDLSDGFDTAELSELIEVGPEANPTLREP